MAPIRVDGGYAISCPASQRISSVVHPDHHREFLWPDFFTNGWLGIETTSGKHWKELPDDYIVPAAAPDPSGFTIIVGGGDKEVSHQLSGRWFFQNTMISIDAWR